MGVFEIITVIVSVVVGLLVGKPIWTAQANKQNQTERDLENAKAALRGKEIDDEVDDMGDADRRDELSKWVSKGE